MEEICKKCGTPYNSQPYCPSCGSPETEESKILTKFIPLTKVLIQDALKKHVHHYGIEGLEDAIKRCYHTMPKAKETILAEYYEMYCKK